MFQRRFNDEKLETVSMIILFSIVFQGKVLGDCDFELCDWSNWDSWPSGCPDCGYARQDRSRGLCCQTDWSLETCRSICRKDMWGHWDDRVCKIKCHNGGTSYTSYCEFVGGFTGTCCEIDIDECASFPCQNGGTCIDKINSFYCKCPPRIYGEFCETGICQPSLADIVFVLDSSISQTKEEFKKQLNFVNSFIDEIVIGDENLRIAVITYSFEATVEIQFGDYTDKELLKLAVDAIEYNPGATFTHKGLQEASMLFGNSFVKRKHRRQGRRFAFVLTDGMSNDRKKTIEAANQLKAIVETVVSIGIGKEVSHEELLNIASADGSRRYVYSVDSFSALYTILQQLVHLTCDESAWKTISNVVFLLDSSETMTTKDFQIGLDALVYLTLAIIERETENTTANVAMVTFGRDIKLHRGLNDTTLKSSLLPQIQKLILPVDDTCTNDKDCSSSSLDQILEYLQTDVLDNSTHEEEKQTVIIILSNGQLSINSRAFERLKQFKGDKVSAYVIGLGSLANLESLKQLVEDPAMVYALVDGANMSTLDALTSEIFFSSCTLTNDFLKN